MITMPGTLPQAEDYVDVLIIGAGNLFSVSSRS